jgi:hypothetical protein
MTKVEFECAISGMMSEEIYSDGSDKDGLAGLPPGWTKLTVEHREINGKWAAIRDLKEAMVDGIVKQYPEDQRDLQKMAVRLQVDAQFAMLESVTPRFNTTKEVVYMAPRETHPDIKEIIDQMRENLGLESLAYEGEDDADEQEEAGKA